MKNQQQEKEVWVIYEETTYNQKYVSNLGRTKIFSKTMERWAKIKEDFGVSAGYQMIRYNGRMTQLHRIVAEHFLEKPLSDVKLVVNHKNSNKLDNRASNLEWVSYGQNMKHCWDYRTKILKEKPYAELDGVIYYLRKDLSEHLGLSPNVITYWKKGKHKPKLPIKFF